MVLLISLQIAGALCYQHFQERKDVGSSGKIMEIKPWLLTRTHTNTHAHYLWSPSPTWWRDLLQVSATSLQCTHIDNVCEHNRPGVKVMKEARLR